MAHKLIIKRDKYIISIFADRVSRMFVDAGKIVYECSIYINRPKYTNYNHIVHPIVANKASTNKEIIR